MIKDQQRRIERYLSDTKTTATDLARAANVKVNTLAKFLRNDNPQRFDKIDDVIAVIEGRAFSASRVSSEASGRISEATAKLAELVGNYRIVRQGLKNSDEPELVAHRFLIKYSDKSNDYHFQELLGKRVLQSGVVGNYPQTALFFFYSYSSSGRGQRMVTALRDPSNGAFNGFCLTPGNAGVVGYVPAVLPVCILPSNLYAKLIGEGSSKFKEFLGDKFKQMEQIQASLTDRDFF